MINPHDIDGLKDRLVEAMNDSPRNKARRMRMMRRQVVENDIESGRAGPRRSEGLTGSGSQPSGRLSSAVLPRLDSNQQPFEHVTVNVPKQALAS